MLIPFISNLHNMKLKYFYIFLLTVSTSNILAQDNDKQVNIDLLKNRKQNVIKTGLFCPFWGSILLTSEYRFVYETPTSARTSVQIGASYLAKNFWLWPIIIDTLKQNNPQASQYTIKGFRVQLAFKYYVFKDQVAPDGLYFAPFLSYSMASIGTPDSYLRQTYIKIVYINANLIMGYQFFYMNQVAIDFYFGLGIKQNSYLEYDNGKLYKRYDPADFEFIKTPLKIVMGVNIGLGF